MRWRSNKDLKTFGEKRQYKWFLLWPMKHKGYWYWLETAMVEDWWIGHRWSKSIKIIEILTPKDTR